MSEKIAEIPPDSPRRRGLGIALWVVSVLIMLGAAVYQRETGPTNPLRDTVTLDNHVLAYSLRREGVTTEPARITVPPLPNGITATLHYRRYPTAESYATRPMRPEAGHFVATLPLEPAAGKLEYFITFETPSGQVRIPQEHGNTVVFRYKDPVPLGFLLPHIAFMFFAMLFGVRAGLGALVGGPAMRRDATIALGLMTVGGMILGPIVQRFAFGQLWTGVPFGYDLTDNKTLLMWLIWVAAVAVLRPRVRLAQGARRTIVIGAAVVMLAVYLVPHSLRGSQLDYGAVEHVDE